MVGDERLDCGDFGAGRAVIGLGTSNNGVDASNFSVETGESVVKGVNRT